MRNGRNETTTAGNYLILLPPSPPRIVSVRAGARLISPSGIWKFPPPPGPAPLHQDSSVSAQVRHTRIKHMRSVCTRCVIEKEPSIFYHPPPLPPSRLVTRRPMLLRSHRAVLFPLFHARVAGSVCSLEWPPDPRLIMFIRVYIDTYISPPRCLANRPKSAG